jgi:hypothetical protein
MAVWKAHFPADNGCEIVISIEFRGFHGGIPKRGLKGVI